MRTLKKKSPSPDDRKMNKANLFRNESPEELEEIRELMSESSSCKISVRLDQRTWIEIDPEKNTPEYLSKARKRLSIP